MVGKRGRRLLAVAGVVFVVGVAMAGPVQAQRWPRDPVTPQVLDPDAVDALCEAAAAQVAIGKLTMTEALLDVVEPDADVSGLCHVVAALELDEGARVQVQHAGGPQADGGSWLLATWHSGPPWIGRRRRRRERGYREARSSVSPRANASAHERGSC